MKSDVLRERRNSNISLDTFRSRRMDHTVFHKWIIKQANKDLLDVEARVSYLKDLDIVQGLLYLPKIPECCLL